MSESAPASLTSSLLARKGEARPAALPEDNYSPINKSSDSWRGGDAEPSGPEPNVADPSAPTLFDALDGNSKGEADVEKPEPAVDEERPEATLSQIRVQRSERVRLQPAVNDPIDVGAPAEEAAAKAGIDEADEVINAVDAGAVATPQSDEPSIDFTVAPSDAAQGRDEIASVAGPEAGDAETTEDAQSEDKGEEQAFKSAPEPETDPAHVGVSTAEAVPIPVPPTIAAAALRQDPPLWRRQLTTFSLSFLIGGALAFVGWSIYSKGDFGEKQEPRAVNAAPTQAPHKPVSAGTSPPTAAVLPRATTAAAESAATEPPAVAAETAKPQVLSVRFADDGRATIVGTASPDSQLVLLDNGALLATVTADSEGIWSYLGDAALADGTHSFAVAAVATTVAAKLSTAPSATPPAESATTSTDPGSRSEASRPLPPPDVGQSSVEARTKVLPAVGDGAADADDQAEDVVEHARLDSSAVPLPAERHDRSGSAVTTARYVVQLASVPSAQDAERFWQKLSERQPGLTDQHRLLVHTGTLPQGRTVFRVRAGPFENRQAAQKACRSFRQVIGECLVVKRLETQS